MKGIAYLFVCVVCKLLEWACNHPLRTAVFAGAVILGLHAAEGLSIQVPDTVVQQVCVTDDTVDGVDYCHFEYRVRLFAWAGDTACEEDLD